MHRPQRQRRFLLAAIAALPLLAAPAWAVTAGQPAPAFEVKDASGRTVKLADFKGRYVVLEWTNPACPFVAKHYGAKNMQALQKDASARNVAWLSISSTAPGQGDYLAPDALAQRYRQWGAAPTALLMDDAGTIGKAYGAKTTPHMFVIDPSGNVVYAGGIDDKRSTNPADIPTAKNFVRAALDESLAGKPVSASSAPPYGCSVKYAS